MTHELHDLSSVPAIAHNPELYHAAHYSYLPGLRIRIKEQLGVFDGDDTREPIKAALRQEFQEKTTE